MPSRIYHIEDDVLWRDAIDRWCAGRNDVTLVGSSGRLWAGVEECLQLKPDIVVLDLILPDATTTRALDAVLSMPGSSVVFVLTAMQSQLPLYALTWPMVKGLIWKSPAVVEDLNRTFDTAMSGGRFLAAPVKNAFLVFRSAPDAFFKILSKTELELLPHIIQGSSDGEIALKNGVCCSTVKTHRLHILRKLGMTSTEKLICWAVIRGFLPAPLIGGSEAAGFPAAAGASAQEKRVLA